MSNANPSGLTEDPLLALVNEEDFDTPVASQVSGPTVTSRMGMMGTVLTALALAVFFALIPLDTPNARPIDMTGVYEVDQPIPLPDVLGIEYLDRDILAGR